MQEEAQQDHRRSQTKQHSLQEIPLKETYNQTQDWRRHRVLRHSRNGEQKGAIVQQSP